MLLQKTEKARLELSPGVRTLSLRERSLLLLADGKPLTFVGGGDILAIRVYGGNSGETFLVLESPDFHTAAGDGIVASVAGGRARVQ